LNLDNTYQIIIENFNAKEYLEKRLAIKELYKYFPEKEDDEFWKYKARKPNNVYKALGGWQLIEYYEYK